MALYYKKLHIYAVNTSDKTIVEDFGIVNHYFPLADRNTFPASYLNITNSAGLTTDDYSRFVGWSADAEIGTAALSSSNTTTTPSDTFAGLFPNATTIYTHNISHTIAFYNEEDGKFFVRAGSVGYIYSSPSSWTAGDEPINTFSGVSSDKIPSGGNLWTTNPNGQAFITCIGNLDMQGKIINAFTLECRGIKSDAIQVRASTVFNTVNLNLLNELLGTVTEVKPPSDDPYGPGGGSTPGGGGGDFDGTSDEIPIPSLPAISVTDSGLMTLYVPTVGELRNFGHFLWSDLFDVATFKKLFTDPMQAIYGLSIIPDVWDLSGATITPRTIKLGNVDTDVSSGSISQQFFEVPCGTINVNEYWGAYLDYDPYTKCEIFLPYIGVKALSIDDVMAKTVEVVYHVDVVSGACTAFVKCGSSVLYTFVGECACSVPLSANDWTGVINGALNIVGQAAGIAATGGLSIPSSVAKAGGAAAKIAKIGAAASEGASTANSVSQMKVRVERSGSIGGTGGLMAVQYPYLILTRPIQALPDYQNTYTGYPSFITADLGEITGYTEVYSIHYNHSFATEDEMVEIDELLHNGVIF